jgi:hypothetical protein
MKKIVLVVALIVLGSVLVFVWLFSKNLNVDVPERLANIPADAKWVGGHDGGSWFQVLNATGNNSFYIKIYNDNTGEVEAKSSFILNPGCVLGKIDSATLIRSISGFDGSQILLSIPEEGRKCFLTPQ